MSKSKKRFERKAVCFRPDEKEINRLEWWAFSIQIFVPIIWTIRLWVFRFNYFLWWEEIVICGGVALAMISQLRIFIPTQFSTRRLLFTGDVFKYTRHPMYTGMAIADFPFWHYNIDSMAFIVTAAFMYVIMFLAAWMQEKEILAKFGPAAESYYARTPRFFFFYPFVRRK
jgi:protein-S-isoprenylcysteine O-methyltransferase Ste14